MSNYPKQIFGNTEIRKLLTTVLWLPCTTQEWPIFHPQCTLPIFYCPYLSVYMYILITAVITQVDVDHKQQLYCLHFIPCQIQQGENKWEWRGRTQSTFFFLSQMGSTQYFSIAKIDIKANYIIISPVRWVRENSQQW